MGKGHLKKGAKRKKVVGAREDSKMGLGFGAAVEGMWQYQHHFVAKVWSWSRYNPSWLPEHKDLELPVLYKHSTSIGQHFSGTDETHINCNDLGCSLAIPAVCLKLFGFVSRVMGWRSWINSKSLLGIMCATALKGKTQAGACECHLKLFILQFRQRNGDEALLQPLCRKVCLNHGLASCFTHMKRWWFGRVSWEHQCPRIYLPASAFVPSVLPRSGVLPHTVGYCHPQSDGAILASGNWNHVWERKMQGGGWSSSDLC